MELDLDPTGKEGCLFPNPMTLMAIEEKVGRDATQPPVMGQVDEPLAPAISQPLEMPPILLPLAGGDAGRGLDHLSRALALALPCPSPRSDCHPVGVRVLTPRSAFMSTAPDT